MFLIIVLFRYNVQMNNKTYVLLAGILNKKCVNSHATVGQTSVKKKQRQLSRIKMSIFEKY